MKLDNKISANSIKKIGTVAGVISTIIVAYYVTGLYRNYLQIKKLKEEGSAPLKSKDE